MAAFSPTMAMNMVVHPLQRHIKEIKRRLLVIGATIMVFFVVAFTYSGLLIEWFKRPFEDDLIFYAPAEALFASIKISFLAAIVVSVPMILYQFWKFIEPSLLKNEQRWAVPLFFLGLGFFLLGLVFCNLIILPLVINFFVTFGMDRAITPELAVGMYVDLAFGFAFEIPLVLSLLARVGILQASMLIQYRKHAAMVALILSAVITPDATMFTMLLMAIPLIVLYEIGIWGAKFFGRVPKPATDDQNVDETDSGMTDEPKGS
jgi:sec-independent protein translocase protein TatC